MKWHANIVNFKPISPLTSCLSCLREQPICWNIGCNFCKVSGNVLFSTKGKGPHSLGTVFLPCICTFHFMHQCLLYHCPEKLSHMCQIPAVILPLLNSLHYSFQCDKAVPTETEAETECSLVVVSPSQPPRVCISLMSHDLMVSTFPVSQKTMSLNLIS